LLAAKFQACFTQCNACGGVGNGGGMWGGTIIEPPDEYEGGGDWWGPYSMEMDGGTCNGMVVWHLNKMDAEGLHRRC